MGISVSQETLCSQHLGGCLGLIEGIPIVSLGNHNNSRNKEMMATTGRLVSDLFLLELHVVARIGGIAVLPVAVD